MTLDTSYLSASVTCAPLIANLNYSLPVSGPCCGLIRLLLRAGPAPVTGWSRPCSGLVWPLLRAGPAPVPGWSGPCSGLVYSVLICGLFYLYVGLLWRLRPNETEMLLCNITRNLLDSLEEETGVHAGFHMNGGLFIASTKERLDEYKRLQTVS